MRKASGCSINRALITRRAGRHGNRLMEWRRDAGTRQTTLPSKALIALRRCQLVLNSFPVYLFEFYLLKKKIIFFSNTRMRVFRLVTHDCFVNWIFFLNGNAGATSGAKFKRGIQKFQGDSVSMRSDDSINKMNWETKKKHVKCDVGGWGSVASGRRPAFPLCFRDAATPWTRPPLSIVLFPLVTSLFKSVS